jgi:hypothetical protein
MLFFPFERPRLQRKVSDVAAAHCGARPCRRRYCRQAPALQGILRRSRELGPRRTHHRPCRGRTRWCGHALHRHQSCCRIVTHHLPEGVLPAWPGGEPHQVLQDPPGGRSYVLPHRERQPTAAVPARRCLLGIADCPRRHPQDAATRHRSVQNPADEPDQDRRALSRPPHGSASPSPRPAPKPNCSTGWDAALGPSIGSWFSIIPNSPG